MIAVRNAQLSDQASSTDPQSSSAPEPLSPQLQALTRHTRRHVGVVGVDAGTMAIAGTSSDPDYDWDNHVWEDYGSPGQVISSTVYSSTGFGDGAYDVVALTDTQGVAVGLEVVFLASELDDLAASTIERLGIQKPSDDDALAVWSGEPTTEQKTRYDEYEAMYSSVAQGLWEGPALLAIEPSLTEVGRLLGHIETTGQLAVGDPCYSSASLTHTVTPGRYAAIVWLQPRPDGTLGRVARLGVYKTD